MTVSDRVPEELKTPICTVTLIPAFCFTVKKKKEEKSQGFQLEAIRQLALINFSMW